LFTLFPQKLYEFNQKSGILSDRKWVVRPAKWFYKRGDRVNARTIGNKIAFVKPMNKATEFYLVFAIIIASCRKEKGWGEFTNLYCL